MTLFQYLIPFQATQLKMYISGNGKQTVYQYHFFQSLTTIGLYNNVSSTFI